MPSRRTPRPDSIPLSPRHERWVVGISLALLLSGLLWLLFHYCFTVAGEFGDTRHPLEVWWLRLHGAAAMGFLVVLGSVLPVHVRRAWTLRKNFRTGLVVLGVIAALVVTGYALYYAGSEDLRPWISGLHWAIGLVGATALVAHVYVGRRGARRRTSPASGDRLHRSPAAQTRGSGPRLP